MPLSPEYQREFDALLKKVANYQAQGLKVKFGPEIYDDVEKYQNKGVIKELDQLVEDLWTLHKNHHESVSVNKPRDSKRR